MPANSIRSSLDSVQRATTLRLTIDPGFVHYRSIQTLLGSSLMTMVDSAIGILPAMPDTLRQIRINHIYAEALLRFCEYLKVPTLGELLANGRGRLVCSTEEFSACPEIYAGEKRVVSHWISNGEYDLAVEFHYSTRHICADTMRMVLNDGGAVAIVAGSPEKRDGRLVLKPLLMGFPALLPDSTEPPFDIMWYSHEFYEHFVEDIDEFVRVRETPEPPSPEPMRFITEKAFKTCLAELLGDKIQNDWGGETSDYYTAHLHLNGQRVTAAFLLKGPARFEAMTLNNLGKNNDQIVRLAKEPANLLVVQHCHDILQPVRDTLRAFAVQPSRPRRYCLIDGRDSLRILQAYGLYDRAIALSAR